MCPEPNSTGQESTYAVRDDVGVAVERPLRVTVLGLVTGEVPNDQSLVSGSREKHVGARELLAGWNAGNILVVASSRVFVLLHGSRQAGDPAILYKH